MGEKLFPRQLAEEVFHPVHMIGTGLIGLSLIERGAHLEDARKFAKNALDFLKMMEVDLTFYFKDPNAGIYNVTDVFKHAGINPITAEDLVPLQQEVRQTTEDVQSALENNREAAERSHQKLSTWWGWYRQAVYETDSSTTLQPQP